MASNDNPSQNIGAAPEVFLSYRRSDTQELTESLSSRLRDDLGSRNVFRDVDDLIAGQQWAEVLATRIDDSDALLAVVGPAWEGREPDGSRRIDREDDPVRVEVTKALADDARAVPIPVLVDRNDLPDLPAELAPLRSRHFVAATEESLTDPASDDYQQVLVAVWEALRSHHPGAVLIIGDNRAQADLDRLVDELKGIDAVDATDLSRFAAGAYLVTPRSARKAGRRWPDVIVVNEDESPSAVVRARLRAAYESPTVRRIAVVGAGSAALVAFAAGSAAASSASVTSYASTAQLTSAVSTAGSGLSGTVGSAWASATVGVKVAVFGAVIGVSGWAAASLVGDAPASLEFAAATELTALPPEDDRWYPLGEPERVTVALGDPLPADETAPVSDADELEVRREVSLAVVPGESAASLGFVTLASALTEDEVARLDDGEYSVGSVSGPVEFPPDVIAVEDFCFRRDDPSVVDAGWWLTGEDATADVVFVVAIEDGAVAGTRIVVSLEGRAQIEYIRDTAGRDLSDCAGDVRNVTWTS